MNKIERSAGVPSPIELPDDCRWAGEFSFSDVEQAVTRTIGGGIIYQRGKMFAGKPIELTGDDESAWIDRTTILLLENFYNDVNGEYNLTFNGTIYPVIFDYTDGSPLSTEPVVDCADPTMDMFYTFNLKFLTV